MKNLFNEICALGGIILVSVTGAPLRDEINTWATFICTLLITLTTVGLQIYRMIRDRDNDKKKQNTTTDEKNEEKKTE